MNRRSFLTVLAALPLVRWLVPSKPSGPVLTEADALADLRGTERPDNPSFPPPADALVLESVTIGQPTLPSEWPDDSTLCRYSDGAWRIVGDFPSIRVYMNGVEVTRERPYFATGPVNVQLVGTSDDDRPGVYFDIPAGA